MWIRFMQQQRKEERKKEENKYAEMYWIFGVCGIFIIHKGLFLMSEEPLKCHKTGLI